MVLFIFPCEIVLINSEKGFSFDKSLRVLLLEYIGGDSSYKLMRLGTERENSWEC
jgi:hypothetical protein